MSERVPPTASAGAAQSAVPPSIRRGAPEPVAGARSESSRVGITPWRFAAVGSAAVPQCVVMEATVTDEHVAGASDLVGALDDLDLRLLDPALETERRALRSLVSGYLEPRSEAPDGPLVVAVVGESGSGKSTIVNSLARHRVSPPGTLRPTTTSPVVWTAQPLPGTLDEVRRIGRVVTEGAGPPEGIVVVDTPPPRVRGDGNRSIAEMVLDRADVCFLVASGARYADAGGWSLLRRAALRHLPVVVVLNRLPENPEIQGDVVADLVERLIAVGVATDAETAPLVTVAEGPLVAETGGLPPEWIARVHKELDALADLGARRAVIRRVSSAARRRAERGLIRLREAMVDAALIHGDLKSRVDGRYAQAVSSVRRAIASGEWSDLGPGSEALETDLAAIVSRRAGHAARSSAEGWDAVPAGRRLLAAAPELWTHGEGMFEAARRRFADWDGSLDGLVLDTLGRHRIRRRRLRRMTDLVRRSALDPSFRPGHRRSQRLLERLSGAPDVARHWLAGVAEEIISGDAARFHAVLGHEPTGEVLQRLVAPEAPRG